jgi:hypothetical protein
LIQATKLAIEIATGQIKDGAPTAEEQGKESRSEAYQQRSVFRSHSRAEIIDLDSAQGGM